MADLDPANLHKLRVVDLKEILVSKGLSTNGLKAELVKRLRDVIMSENVELETECHPSDVGYDRKSDSCEDNPPEHDTVSEMDAQEHTSTDSEQPMDTQEIEEIESQTGLEQKRLEDEAGRRMAEEHQRRMAEERQKRLADAEEQRIQEEERLISEDQEKQRMLEQQRLLEEQRSFAEEEKRKEQRKFEEGRAEEEQRRFEEEERMKEEQVRFEEEKKGKDEQVRFEDEEKRKKEPIRFEEEERRKEEQVRIEEEERRKEEQIQFEEEERRKEEQMGFEKELRREEEQIRFEEERRKEEQRRFEEERRKEQRQLEEERRKEEQRKFAEEEKKRKEEQKKLQEAEKQRLLEEERMKQAEIAKQQFAHQQKMLAEKEKIRLAEEQQRLLAEERKRLMAEEQQRLLAEEQQRLLAEEQRLMAEEQRRLLVEEQQRILAEQQQKLLAEQQQKILAEQQQKFLGEQQQKMLAHQLVPPGLHPASLPPPLQFTQPPPVPPTSIITTAITSPFPPPPPPPPPASLSIQPPGHEPSNIEKQLEINKNENQIAANKGVNGDQPDEIKLPQAVEKILALKNERAQQLGIDPDAVAPAIELKEIAVKKTVSRALVSLDEIEDEELEEEETNTKVKEAKRRRKKKKKQKRSVKVIPKDDKKRKRGTVKEKNIDIDIEYVQDVLDPSDPLYSQFVKIFERFKLSESDKDKTNADILMEEAKQEPKVIDKKKPMDLDDDDEDDDERDDEKKEEDKPKLSKRKLKKLSRMTVAELKQKVIRPELVEMHDVTAKDPVLLLHLKASRNTVPVPRHWCFKRKYLQGKRGIEKPAFELPDFIKRTGIMEMRQALQEKEDQKTMKAKMRERVRPKLGKIDIDYQKLHDAFFKWQTKPKMTIHGDLYYEGKEFETRLKEKKPGDLNDDLRIALGMPTGPNANKCPPPWLIAMQRYGPPPSYPNLKIPGLNAPIPDACSFGYHAGGWGKPPVDEQGRPLYGDVFGTLNADNQPLIPEEEIDHTKWGELESESSEEEEDEEDEDEEEEEQKGEDETGLVTPAEGLITPSGFSSIPAGMETPDMIELRKRKIEAEMEGGETPALYTIVPEKKSERVGAAMMGSTHIYDLAAAIPAAKVKVSGTTSVPPQGIEVALDPSELEMDTAAMAARYEQTMREQQSQLEKEDLSDMVAEHAARQKTKRKKLQQDSGKAPKKYKEFKF